MRRTGAVWAALAGVVGCGALLLFATRSSNEPPRVAAKPSPLAKANAAYAAQPKKAASEYATYVVRNERSRDPVVQDHVGAAKVRLGYLAAKRKDFVAARQTFLAAAKTKGTGARGEFGTLNDQAAYQAVVCLVAAGKRAEAREGFEDYLRERPLSSLARAAHRRLALLNGGKTTAGWDAMLQADVARQEANVRFETSVCGPRCLARITGRDYKALARLCGTKDSGTTVEGMRKGLKALGLPNWAVRLSRDDLARAKLPAVMLEGDHYVVVERVEGDVATLWDPRFRGPRAAKLPPRGDPDYSATLIVLSRPEGL